MFPSLLKSSLLLATAATLLFFAGCKSRQATIIDQHLEDIDKPVEGWALRKLDPKDYPDMRASWSDKTNLVRAIDKSLQFLHAPSSARYYPSKNPGDTITHDQIVATLVDIKNLINKGISPDQFQQEVLARYDVYTSKGYNDKGDVWFTGYFTPIYHGSLTRTAEYQYPVYKRPADLHSDPITGHVPGGYPTRAELMDSGKLKGLELVWFKKPFEPFMIQVQGSAKVILPNNQEIYLGFDGSNDREHKGLGTLLVKEGKIEQRKLTLPAVIKYYDDNPGELDKDVRQDDRFVFVAMYHSPEWPQGSIGVNVTADRSLATDKHDDIFPRAALTFVDTAKPNASGELQPYKGLVLDQDTGGGIRAAGHADLYMGIGDQAGVVAGNQLSQGHLYYLFLKPENMHEVNFPALKPTPAPKGLTPGTPKKGAHKTPTTPTTPRGTGSDDMFPGAVKK